MGNVQNVHKQFFSTRELAGIVGVSGSSIKRWVDDGRIATMLTAGGHRRIPLTEALRFIRREGISPKRPETLGIVPLDSTGPTVSLDAGERLYEALRDGRADVAVALLQSLYLAGRNLDRIIDGPFRGALERLGKLWLSGVDGIYQEHRATQISIHALHRLRSLQEPRADTRLTALGGAPAGDPYLLPSLAVATVLDAVGISATDLGPDAPIEALCHAIKEQRPDFIWLSVTAPLETELLNGRVSRLLDAAEAHDAQMIVGGQQADRLTLPETSRLFRCDSMTDLTAFVRGAVSVVNNKQEKRGDVR